MPINADYYYNDAIQRAKKSSIMKVNHHFSNKEFDLNEAFVEVQKQKLSLSAVFRRWKDQNYKETKDSSPCQKALEKYLPHIQFYHEYLSFLKNQGHKKITIPYALTLFLKNECGAIEHFFPKKEINIALELDNASSFITLINDNVKALKNPSFNPDEFTTTFGMSEHLSLFPEYTQRFLNILKSFKLPRSTEELRSLMTEASKDTNGTHVLNILKVRVFTLSKRMFNSLAPLPIDFRPACYTASLNVAFSIKFGFTGIGDEPQKFLLTYLKEYCNHHSEPLIHHQAYLKLKKDIIEGNDSFENLFLRLTKEVNVGGSRLQYVDRKKFKELFKLFINYYPREFEKDVFRFIGAEIQGGVQRVDLFPEYLEALKEEYEQNTSSRDIQNLIINLINRYSSQAEENKESVHQLKTNPSTQGGDPRFHDSANTHLKENLVNMRQNLIFFENITQVIKTRTPDLDLGLPLSESASAFIPNSSSLVSVDLSSPEEKEKEDLLQEIDAAKKTIQGIRLSIPKKRTWVEFFSYLGKDPVQIFWEKCETSVTSMQEVMQGSKNQLVALPELALKIKSRISERETQPLQQLFKKVETLVALNNQLNCGQ